MKQSIEKEGKSMIAWGVGKGMEIIKGHEVNIRVTDKFIFMCDGFTALSVC